MVAHTCCADVAVLVGVSTACSISSCLTISSASSAWSGESEPGAAEKQVQRRNAYMLHHPDVTNRTQTNHIMIIKKKKKGSLRVCLPFLAGEKKLKTGEKMVPRRVVLGGLVVTSTAVVSSRLPLDFSLLLS